MRHLLSFSIVLISVATLAAQSESQPTSAPAKTVAATGFAAPPGAMGRFSLDLGKKAQAAWPSTALGAMEQDPEVAAFIKLFQDRLEARGEELAAMVALGRNSGVEEKALERALAMAQDEGLITPDRLWVYIYPPKNGADNPSVFATAFFDKAQADSLSKLLSEVQKAALEEDFITEPKTPLQLAGHNATTMIIAEPGTEEVQLSWLRQGSTFYLAVGRAGLLSEAQAASDLSFAGVMPQASPTAVLSAHLDVKMIKDASEKEAKANDTKESKIAKILGMNSVESIAWELSLEGKSLRETTFVGIPQGPTGLLKALIPPKGSSVAQAPPVPVNKQMFSLEGALDGESLVDLILKALKESGEDIPESGIPGLDPKKIASIFNGAYSLAIGRPNLLNPMPKIAIALGISDLEGLAKLIEFGESQGEGLAFDRSEYRGTKIVQLIIPNSSAKIAPTYAILKDTFYVADSPKTLKRIIRNIKTGKIEAGRITGEVPPSLPLKGMEARIRLRYDTKSLFKLIYGQLFSVVPMLLRRVTGDSPKPPMIEFSELPSAATLAKYLSPGAGGAAWGPGGLYLSTASPLGNPLLNLLGSAGAPLGAWAMGFGIDKQIAMAEQNVLAKRATKLRDALGTWRSSFGAGTAWPESLGGLFTRGLIEDVDILIVPSDKAASSIEYEDDEGEFQELKNSYKYLPHSKLILPSHLGAQVPDEVSSDVTIGLGQGRVKLMAKPWTTKEGHSSDPVVILYEARQNAHGGRILILSDGSVLHLPEESFKQFISLK